MALPESTIDVLRASLTPALEELAETPFPGDRAAPAMRQDLEKINPGRRPLLHLNRAVVATRTHQAHIVEEAFARLTRDLPEDAPRFFSQGMEQMDLLNYPPRVRDVTDRYYRKWSVDRSLH